MHAIAVAVATQRAEFRKRLADARRRLAGELDEVEAARIRLEVGQYGGCEGCHQAIPLPRLRAMPATRHCAGCQPQHTADA